MRFEIQKRIGSGATGVVYLARDTVKGSIVALKQLRPEVLFPEREVLLAQKVTHPNVCRVYEFFKEDGIAQISMEYIEGESLRSVIARGRVPVDEALGILRQVIDGVTEAHRQGVMHRDLKPENILIAADGAVKITDFGLACTIDPNEPVTRAAGGTPGYMAPEQSEQRTADARSDIYAVGVILHEMLAGERTLSSRPVMPAGVPSNVERVIWRCLDRDPAQRYQSFAELGKALAEPVRLRRPVPSITGILAVSLLIVVAAAIGLWRYTAALRVGAGMNTAAVGARPLPGSKENSDGKPQASNAQNAAQKALSDGIYFLQNNLAEDALAQFNRALEMDGDLSDAHFQRGLALVKLKRWDDAIAAFKRALPGAAAEHRDLWSWKTSFPAGSKHGLLLAAANRVIYGERKGKATVLHIIDPGQHNFRRLEILDDTIRLNAPDEAAWANDRVSVVMAADVRASAVPGKGNLYGISAADGSLLWHNQLEDSGPELPLAAVTADAVLVYLSHKRMLTLLDDQTGKPRWTRPDLTIDRRIPPIIRSNIILLKSEDQYRAVRASDGTDAWTVHVPELAANISPAVAGNTIYFVSSTFEVGAIEAGTTAGSLLWQKPIHKKLTSMAAADGQVVVGTTDGEWIAMDAKAGAMVSSGQPARSSLSVDYAGGDVVIASSAGSVYRLGSHSWQYASGFPLKAVKYFNGIVTVRTSETELTALDAGSGAVLWQNTELAGPAGIFPLKDSLLVVDQRAVHQYSMEPPSKNVTNKSVLTEAAAALISNGNLDDAAAFVDKVAREIDPDYPRLRLIRARLLLAQEKAKGHAPPLQAGSDLASYANLAGRDSESSRDAIAEMKRDYGLLWNQTTETVAPGLPEIVAGRLINTGAVRVSAQTLALNPQTGEVVWRQPFQRFVDNVAVRSALFSAGGDANDPTAVILNRIDVASGERTELTRWNRPSPVDQARIAHAAGRLYVETISRNTQTSRAEVGLDCIDAVSGRRLWQRNHDVQATRLLMLFPAGLFMVQGDSLIYSAGQEIWTVRGTDGTVLDRQPEDGVIGDNVSHSSVPPGPVYFVTAQPEISAYDPALKTITRTPRPEVDSPQLTMRGNTLFAVDKGSAYRFDIGSGLKWMIPGATTAAFLRIRDDGSRLWALRSDNVLVAIDPVTGKVLREYSTLWRPLAYNVIGDRLYALTADGLAYAILLSH